MRTVQEEYEQEAWRGDAPLDPETRFHSELFGFDRVEVLSYIERISAANAEKARALEQTIEALQQDLDGARAQGSVLEQKASRVFDELETQKKRAEDAVAQAGALRAEVDRANDEIAAVRSRLFAREQENAALRSDNERLNETVEDLTRALTRRGVPLPERALPQDGAEEADRQARRKAGDILRTADAKAQAQLDRARTDAREIVSRAKQEGEQIRAELERSVDGIAASISLLKQQLAAVDAKILAATSDLQKATEGIAAALGTQAEGTAGTVPQMPVRPQSVDAVPDGPDLAERHAAPAARGREAGPERGERIRREEDAYYSALRQVRYEEALRDRLYEEERMRQDVMRRVRQEEAARAREDAYIADGDAPAQPAEAASAKRRKAAPPVAPPAPMERPAQAKVPEDPLITERWMHTKEDGAADSGARGGFAGQAAAAHGAIPQEGRPVEPQEQYDAVQHAAQNGYPEIPDMPAQPVVQKVELPQVPARVKPEFPVEFGKPHAPRAMPFAPFDPYTPHTAPYIEPDAEAARVLNTPPPPPPRGTAAKKPYVPQPTPIAPSLSLSQPYVQPAATVLAGMPQAQPNVARVSEPVIIPYSMPIPPRGDEPGAEAGGGKNEAPGNWGGQAARGDARQAERPAERTGKDSALSDDLLAHLNELLRSGKDNKGK